MLLWKLLLLVLFRSSPWHYVVGPGARYWEARIPREQPQFPPSFSHWCPALGVLLLLVLLLELLLLFAARGARAPSTARARFFKRLCCVQLGEGRTCFLINPFLLLIPIPDP